MKKALVIEDDDGIRANIVELLTEEGFAVVEADNGRTGLALALAETPSLIICDVRIPEPDGLHVLQSLRSSPTTRTTPFIFLSAAAARADVRAGMNLGADDYLTKPFTRGELLDAIRIRLERTESRDAATPAEGMRKNHRGALPSLSEPIVLAPATRALYESARKAAAATISVFILGETGVGKEVLAHSVHRLSPRREAPFLALNCAALSETLLESELFGSEKGAFTGSITTRPGLFETASGGTVFLDELAELPMTIQVKLLRVLEDRTVMRIGGRKPIAVDVRFITATNGDIEEHISRGTFRLDLYYRLAGITLSIPPLRERPEEILPLALKFARTAAVDLGRAPDVQVSAEAEERLLRHSWPGNVRELKNVMERAVILAPSSAIDVEHLPPKLTDSSERDSVPPPENGGPQSVRTVRGEMLDLERKRIVEALEKCGGNQTAAAELLGMSRRTLVSRLSQYQLPRPRKRE